MRFKFKKPDGGFEHSKGRMRTISEFLECIEWKWKKWKKAIAWSPQENCPWFRGVQREDYKLVPSIYRGRSVIGWKYTANQAVDMQAEFARRAKPFINAELSYGDGEYLHLMQHYRFPTRLLDWTEGALIALYFAIRISTGTTSSPCVWMLNPSWLNFVNDVTTKNTKTKEDKSLVLYTDRRAMKKHDPDSVVRKHYLREHRLAKLPVAVFPPHMDRRIVAQKSVFTIHGREKDGFGVLRKLHPDAQVCKIRITSDDQEIEAMTKDLNRAGVTETAIFPDLEGLSREIQAEYKMPLRGP